MLLGNGRTSPSVITKVAGFGLSVRAVGAAFTVGIP